MSHVRWMAATALLMAAPAAAQQPAGQDSGAMALRFADVELSTGIRMHYGVQGNPSGKAVILLHGYTDSSFSWTRVLPLLPRDWRVYAVDLRGHGESDKPEGGYATARMAADIVAFMDAEGLGRATIVGHSGGGLIAQRVMIDAPERVERAVLVATVATGADITDYDGFAEAVMALTEPVDTAFVRTFQMSTVARPVPAPFMEGVIGESLKLPARVWKAYFAGVLGGPAPVELRTLDTPTLILLGDRDAIVSLASQERLLRIPGSKLVVYEGIGHAPNWEDPERVVRDLVGFIR